MVPSSCEPRLRQAANAVRTVIRARPWTCTKGSGATARRPSQISLLICAPLGFVDGPRPSRPAARRPARRTGRRPPRARAGGCPAHGPAAAPRPRGATPPARPCAFRTCGRVGAAPAASGHPRGPPGARASWGRARPAAPGGLPAALGGRPGRTGSRPQLGRMHAAARVAAPGLFSSLAEPTWFPPSVYVCPPSSTEPRLRARKHAESIAQRFRNNGDSSV